jgi:hypothetical protein
MPSTIAILAKELETYLALFGEDCVKMWGLTATFIDDNRWGRNAKTGEDIMLYIGTHRKVDGKDWSCGSFGSRWADTVINGKMVRIAFYSKKMNPAEFENVPEGHKYKIVVQVLYDPKEEKHKKSAEDYTETFAKAIKSIGNGLMTDNAEVRNLLKVVIDGRRKSDGETVFYWHKGTKQVCWNTNEEMREQAKLWKQDMKKGNELQCLEDNCQTKLVNGKEWYILVVGHKTEDFGIDPLGMGIDDGSFVVSGMIYWFKHKASRDTIFAYLNK